VLELQTSQLTRAGITGVIGMLGFDATSKHARAHRRAKAFKEDGISAWALTGATLEHPVPTLTGRIRDDIAFVEEIIGVGEISVSELGYAYDSNGPGAQYIAEAPFIDDRGLACPRSLVHGIPGVRAPRPKPAAGIRTVA
jgi:beta-aspartyl-dipeptidase (metallo-type)